jgi:hypothetical protein
MKCNSCNLNAGKCPDGCLESIYVTSLDSEGYFARRKDDVWREDVYEYSVEVDLLSEDSDPTEIQELIERVCKDHSAGWFPFLQAPLIYDVTRRYGELIRQQQDANAADDGPYGRIV